MGHYLCSAIFILDLLPAFKLEHCKMGARHHQPPPARARERDTEGKQEREGGYRERERRPKPESIAKQYGSVEGVASPRFHWPTSKNVR